MRDSEIKHCQSWREHYYATEAEIKRRGKVTVKPPQRIDMHEAIVAERCETFVSKEMARMPVPLKMAIRTENSRPEITGAGIANLRSTWDRRTMARPAKMTSAAKPRLVRYSNSSYSPLSGSFVCCAAFYCTRYPLAHFSKAYASRSSGEAKDCGSKPSAFWKETMRFG